MSVGVPGLLRAGHDVGAWELRLHQVERDGLLPTITTCYPQRERVARSSRLVHRCPASNLCTACRALSTAGRGDNRVYWWTHPPSPSLTHLPPPPTLTTASTSTHSAAHRPLFDAPTRHHTEHMSRAVWQAGLYRGVHVRLKRYGNTWLQEACKTGRFVIMFVFRGLARIFHRFRSWQALPLEG